MLYYIGIAMIVNAMQMYVAYRSPDFYGRKYEYVMGAMHKGILWPVYAYGVFRDFMRVSR